MAKEITIELSAEGLEVLEAFIARRGQIIEVNGTRTVQREFPEVEDFVEWLVRTRTLELSEQFPPAASGRRDAIAALKEEERIALAPKIIKGRPAPPAPAPPAPAPIAPIPEEIIP